MRKRAGAKEKFLYGMRNVQKMLDEFEDTRRTDAENLVYLYKYRKLDIPPDVYRSVAFFVNREYKTKNGSLYLLFQADERLRKEMPVATVENITELIAYKFKVYTQILEEAGYWKK